MTVHDISEGKRTPQRHQKWRKDWVRRLFYPGYDSVMKRWDVQPLTMFAGCRPFRAAFQLNYGSDYLLASVLFLPEYSKTPACHWQPDGPEIGELVSQIMELYIQRW